MIFDFKGSPIPLDEIPDDFRPAAMGSASEIRQRISDHLPGIDWSDPTWGDYQGDGFSIEFNMGNNEIPDSIMLHVRGGGDAVKAIMAFAGPNNWSVLDTSLGDYLDADNLDESGWISFQKYRDRIIDEVASKDRGHNT